MTIKQKFNSIDQSKLTADQKAFLTKIKDVTKNFTDSEMNKKVEAPLNGFIEKAKEKMPEAIKSAPVKRTAKATASQTKKPKRTAMSLAKEIRKEGESWSDARARASKMMKEDSKDLSKTVETELEKLTKLVRGQKNRAKISGISGTNIKRDASRKAKPRGRRVSANGKVYYENRENRTDRLSPNYPKNSPLLENGAYLTDPNFGSFQSQVLEDGGFFSSGRPKSALIRDRKNVNHSEDYEVRYSRPRPSRTGYSGSRRFELGGTVVSDLAGHTGLGDGGLNAGMPLSGTSGTSYTGLVGETGAMSSGEMFAGGGGVGDKEFSLAQAIAFIKEAKKDRMTFYYNVYGGNDYFTLEPTFATPTGKMKGYPSKVTITKEGKITGKNLTYELGGGIKNIKWQDVEVGDSARVKNMNKMGLIVKTYGRKFHLKFVDGTEKTFDASELEFINDKYELGGGLPSGVSQPYMITESLGNPAQHFNKGGSVTNERKHVNHDEDYEVRYAKPRPSRKGYKGARKFMAGGSMETPRIYVADLEAYNNGKLVGEWLDLANYDDADELMDAIENVIKKSGGEEYAIHDAEYIPSSMYSEYMGRKDFEELYEMMDLAKQNNLPLEVVQDVVSQYGASAVDEFVGKYDSQEDFAQELVDDTGIESFTNFEYYLDVSETDRRLLSQDMADSYVDDIRNEDGGNRLIEEAGLDVEQYEEADSVTQEEMLDEAIEIVYNEVYDNYYEGLNDPYYFLVEEQGLYDAESFAKASFVRVDYEKLANALEQDYAFIQHDGDLYVFNIR
jgi:antirestriction protein